MAVAGFSEDELKIDVKEQTLNVRGEKKAEDKERQFLHRGIATRAFDRRFRLADHVEVKGADLKDGLLHVDLVRNVPERLKPRTVAIGNAKARRGRSSRWRPARSNRSRSLSAARAGAAHRGARSFVLSPPCDARRLPSS